MISITSLTQNRKPDPRYLTPVYIPLRVLIIPGKIQITIVGTFGLYKHPLDPKNTITLSYIYIF
jgi:hypothetical protein